jgi:hypothetical protein
LTRASIDLQKNLSKTMDCRVKPGNDGAASRLTRRQRGGVYQFKTTPRIAALR